MLTIYSVPTSLYCAKLRVLLRHKRLDWRELAPPGGYGSDAYKQFVPSGNLPALVYDDLLLTDSEAIAEYLNEKHPEPPMLPGPISERARIRERSRFHDTRLEPAVRRLFSYLDGKLHPPETFSALADDISTRLTQLAQLLKLSPPSNVLTLGDCGYPITFAWIEALIPILELEISWPPSVSQWSVSLREHPAVAEELVSYRPTVTDWLNNSGACA
ncbi:glutathione S-transferase family protein [Pelagibius sp. Alg239-R121]|uniref:glutathione S-transferase family protein n=1 Tax=Pelagibius sp. Alg239-R121 TaxID=2993448 RepID=UPI0024A6E2E9|nr:glutathione S-transferase family protein [Pelagibius sp. Alg239-R121]